MSQPVDAFASRPPRKPTGWRAYWCEDIYRHLWQSDAPVELPSGLRVRTAPGDRAPGDRCLYWEVAPGEWRAVRTEDVLLVVVFLAACAELLRFSPRFHGGRWWIDAIRAAYETAIAADDEMRS